MKTFISLGVIILTLVSCSVKRQDITEINRRLTSQDEKIAILTEQIMLLDFENLRTMSSRNQTQNQGAGREVPTSTQPSRPTQTQQVTNVSTTGGRTEAEINILYEEGRRHYLNRDFAAAIRSFTIITNQAPNHELAANSFYWIGESYYAMGDFSAARLSFQIVVDRYASSNKYLDSQLKIAMTWIRQNRRDQARVILEDIRRNHPNYESMHLVEQNLMLIR